MILPPTVQVNVFALPIRCIEYLLELCQYIFHTLKIPIIIIGATKEETRCCRQQLFQLIGYIFIWVLLMQVQYFLAIFNQTFNLSLTQLLIRTIIFIVEVVYQKINLTEISNLYIRVNLFPL